MLHPGCTIAFVYEVPRRALEELRPYVAELDPGRVTTQQAAELVELFAEAERVLAAGRILLAPRAAEGDAWCRAGHRTPASWLARVMGSGFGEAIRTIETGERVATLPDTADALRMGRLSPAQAHAVATAAAKHPEAEPDLLAWAEEGTLKQLKGLARQVEASAMAQEDATERENRIHRGRYLRSWTDADGATRIDARLAPLDGCKVLCALQVEANAIFDEALQQGRQERTEAYMADALVRLTTRSGDDADRRGPRYLAHLRADIGAMRRGSIADGDRCEIAGVGPVSLATLEHMVGDAYVKLFLTDGVDVLNVVHRGRTVPSHVQSALEERDPECVVPGCGVARGLETDHWQIPFAQDGPTELWNLARLCRHHHQLKTYEGWELLGGPGKWEFQKPPGPDAAPLAAWEEALSGVEPDEVENRLLFDGL